MIWNLQHYDNNVVKLNTEAKMGVAKYKLNTSCQPVKQRYLKNIVDYINKNNPFQFK